MWAAECVADGGLDKDLLREDTAVPLMWAWGGQQGALVPGNTPGDCRAQSTGHWSLSRVQLGGMWVQSPFPLSHAPLSALSADVSPWPTPSQDLTKTTFKQTLYRSQLHKSIHVCLYITPNIASHVCGETADRADDEKAKKDKTKQNTYIFIYIGLYLFL